MISSTSGTSLALGVAIVAKMINVFKESVSSYFALIFRGIQYKPECFVNVAISYSAIVDPALLCDYMDIILSGGLQIKDKICFSFTSMANCNPSTVSTVKTSNSTIHWK